MMYYPLYIDLQERLCIVIGSSTAPVEEVERKANGLVEAGACVTVITPNLTPQVVEWGRAGRLRTLPRPYQEGDLSGSFLAIAVTTDDPALSQRIADEAARERTLLNVVDVTGLCTWIAPAVIQRGDLNVAISTNGRSPAMARWVKDRVDRALPQEYGALLDVLAEVRQELRRRHVRLRPEAWQEVLNEEYDEALDLLAQGDLDAVQLRILDRLTGARAPAGKP